MDKEQLASYITEELSRGKQKKELISELKVEGWQQADIDVAFNAVEQGTAATPLASAAGGSPAEPLANETPSEPVLPPPGGHPHLRLFLLIGLAALLLGGGLIVVLRLRSQPQTAPVSTTVAPSPLPTPALETPSPAAATPASPEVADCGMSGPEQSDEEAEQATTCIGEYFAGCTPATYAAAVDLTPLAGVVTYYYEIIGKRGAACLVKTKFLENPNPAWIGKEMTCKWDMAKVFGAAAQELTLCSGPLRDLMQGTPSTNSAEL